MDGESPSPLRNPIKKGVFLSFLGSFTMLPVSRSGHPMDVSDRAILRGARAGVQGPPSLGSKGLAEKNTGKTYCRWAPDPVINRVITPISRVITVHNPSYPFIRPFRSHL